MKGITLFSDIFMLIVLIATTVIMSLFIWALIYMFQIEGVFTSYGTPTTRSIEMKLFVKPVIYDSVMLSFLEYQYQGIPMKKILNAAAIQGRTDIWIDGKPINVRGLSQGILNQELTGYYLLKLGQLTIAENGALPNNNLPTGIQKVSTELFLLNGEYTNLQLFVAD